MALFASRRSSSCVVCASFRFVPFRRSVKRFVFVKRYSPRGTTCTRSASTAEPCSASWRSLSCLGFVWPRADLDLELSAELLSAESNRVGLGWWVGASRVRSVAAV